MGVVIEQWLDVKKATTDELHRPLEQFGAAPQPLLIQCEVDLEAQRQGKRLLTEEEQTQLRGSVAGLNWAARQGRPDAAVAASIVASSFPTPSVGEANSANATTSRLKEAEVVIKVWAIPEEDLRRFVIVHSRLIPLARTSRSTAGLLGTLPLLWLVALRRPCRSSTGSRDDLGAKLGHRCSVKPCQGAKRWLAC